MKLIHLLAEQLTDEIPYDTNMEIRKCIKMGANDQNSQWLGGALELVHRAYKEINVERPTPSMRGAWNQYEENIAFAVSELQRATDKKIRDDSWKQTTAHTKIFGY